MTRCRATAAAKNKPTCTTAWRNAWRPAAGAARGLRASWLNLSIFNGLFSPEKSHQAAGGPGADETREKTALEDLVQPQARADRGNYHAAVSGRAYGFLPHAGDSPGIRRGTVAARSEQTPARALAEAAAGAAFVFWLPGRDSLVNENERETAGQLLFEVDPRVGAGAGLGGRRRAARVVCDASGLVITATASRSGDESFWENGLALAEDPDQELELHCINNLGLFCQDTGQPQEAAALLPASPAHLREVGDRAGD